MSTSATVSSPATITVGLSQRAGQAPGSSLAAALLGFFMVTLDAVIVNVALPDIRRELAGGMTGLQWVVDGYTLMFAALMLSSGSLSDRIGARRAFSAGMVVFVLASTACGLAPTLGVLVAGRFVQGSAAAVMMPASMALISHAYPEAPRRARAVAMWSMGGVAASTAGPVLAGVLTLVSWRLIFFVNVPAGVPALSVLMIGVGLAGPLVMPPIMALLLHAVPSRRAGVASGVFNTSRQAGGALAVAVFGALLADRATFVHGLRVSLFIAAAVALAAAAVSRLLARPGTAGQTSERSIT